MTDFSYKPTHGRRWVRPTPTPIRPYGADPLPQPSYPDEIIAIIEDALAQHGCRIGQIHKTPTGITFDVIGAPDTPLSPKAHAAAMNLAELGIICRTETDE
jgi:hypothetical protein